MYVTIYVCYKFNGKMCPIRIHRNLYPSLVIIIGLWLSTEMDEMPLGIVVAWSMRGPTANTATHVTNGSTNTTL